MFVKSARYYDTLYSFKDYNAASAKVHKLIQQHRPGASSLLDVGCGTGTHLRFLAGDYQVVGLDISPDLIAVARAKSPDLTFHVADMVDFELDRRFDVITCLFSAIAYVETHERMRRAVATMAAHLNPGGLMLIEPWFDEDSYWTDTITMNHATDGDDLKIAWMYTSAKEGPVSVLDIQYLVGTPRSVEHFTEQHRMGLFSRQQYLEALQDAGLSKAVFDPNGLFDRGLYVAAR
jgi:SAM-dependent methyltransferase